MKEESISLVLFNCDKSKEFWDASPFVSVCDIIARDRSFEGTLEAAHSEMSLEEYELFVTCLWIVWC